VKKRSGAGEVSTKRDSRDGRGSDAKSSIKRVSLGGVEDNSDDDEFDNSDGLSDKPTRRRSKPHQGVLRDRLFQSTGTNAAPAAAAAQTSNSAGGSLTASAALGTESRGSYTSRGRRANNATPEPTSQGGSPTNSRRSSPTRGSGAQPRRRHRTHTDADGLALPDFADLGDARIDDSPADADEAFQLRRTITYLTHQLSAVRDMVGEAMDAVQASPIGTVRPLVTPRTRGNRRVASGSSSTAAPVTRALVGRNDELDGVARLEPLGDAHAAQQARGADQDRECARHAPHARSRRRLEQFGGRRRRPCNRSARRC
jgi:hypothetical protein